MSTGRLGQGGVLTPGDINAPNIPGVWFGPRKDMDLPYLFLRANPGDLGARPVVGAPFWESPDIFILAGVTPALAPPLPPALGQVALAGEPNTIYAHVWNFGKAAANEIVVEFYWVNPVARDQSWLSTIDCPDFHDFGRQGQRQISRGGEVPGSLDANVCERRP